MRHRGIPGGDVEELKMLASLVTRELAIPVSISATQADCVASSQKMKFV